MCYSIGGGKKDSVIPLPVNFAARERRVKKESNLDVLGMFISLTLVVDLLAQELREKHEMVILHPDQISVAHNLCNGLGKQAVGLLVCPPILLIE
jgi:hypothetical protein